MHHIYEYSSATYLLNLHNRSYDVDLVPQSVLWNSWIYPNANLVNDENKKYLGREISYNVSLISPPKGQGTFFSQNPCETVMDSEIWVPKVSSLYHLPLILQQKLHPLDWRRCTFRHNRSDPTHHEIRRKFLRFWGHCSLLVSLHK